MGARNFEKYIDYAKEPRRLDFFKAFYRYVLDKAASD